MDGPYDTRHLPAELRVGTRVDVHTRYELGRWAPGFTIAEVRPDGYRIRRASDGAVLGETIDASEIRVATPLPSTRRSTQLRARAALRTPSVSTSGHCTGVDR
jgi:hypothetical protein